MKSGAPPRRAREKVMSATVISASVSSNAPATHRAGRKRRTGGATSGLMAAGSFRSKRNSEARSRADWNRFSGSFARQRRMTRSIPGGKSWPAAASGEYGNPIG